MYVPTRHQSALLQRLMEADGLVSPIESSSNVGTEARASAGTNFVCNKPAATNVGILIDTPNATKTAKVYGMDIRPDYSAVRKLAAGYGEIRSALAFVNPGYKTSTAWASRLGYTIVRGTDHDVDHLVVSTAVELLAKGIETLVVVSGDHRFSNIQNICDRLRIRYVAIGVPSRTSASLKKTGSFYPLPVFRAA